MTDQTPPDTLCIIDECWEPATEIIEEMIGQDVVPFPVCSEHCSEHREAFE